MVYDAVKKDSKSLGWSGSLKGSLFPLFLGIMIKFSCESVAIKKLVGNEDLYNLLGETECTITKEQEAEWHKWCIREVEKRVDAIITGKLRRSYNKAARLIAAVYEMWLLRNENDPMSFVSGFLAKYPRHTAFKSELKTAMNDVKHGFL